MSPFSWEGSSIRVELGPDERLFLPSLMVLLATVGQRVEDPAAERLDPPAYEEDEGADAEYRRLIAGELEAARTTDRDRFAATIGADQLSRDDAESWLRVLGDARLALAARKGIVRDEDGWEEGIGDDPELGMLAYLGFLQGSLVEALTAGLETTA